MAILLFLIISYLLLSISLYFLFPKAGVKGIKGLIPGVNFIEWCKLIGRKPVYALWLLFPVVNLFIFVGMAIDLVRSFKRYSFFDSALAFIYAPAIFFIIAKNDSDKYDGPTLPKEKAYADQLEEARKSNDSYKLKQLEEKNPYKKSAPREWVESIVFAVFAASFIRMFLIEAYVIPTPSMEGSLNVGDFLFVSKAHYGIRTPMTVAMVPLLHNQVPVLKKESYFTKPSLPYYRLPAIEKIEAGKPIVFNWPVGDSVYITSSRSYTVSQVEKEPGYAQQDRELVQKIKNKDFVVRPLDKKDHYIKRCVGGPGDSLQIKDKQIYLNGKAVTNPKHLQFSYIVDIPNDLTINEKKLVDWNIHVSQGDIMMIPVEYYQEYNITEPIQGRAFLMILDETQKEQVKSLSKSVMVYDHKKKAEPRTLFPFDPGQCADWSVDNYGPVYIPKAGTTVTIDKKSLPFYQRIISVYENNKLEVQGDDILINGKKAESYTFRQDYYWAMGDNRHNSEDSRSWGFVPFDHIVGKPLFIWFSTKEGNIRKGINWNRLFRSANKE